MLQFHELRMHSYYAHSLVPRPTHGVGGYCTITTFPGSLSRRPARRSRRAQRGAHGQERLSRETCLISPNPTNIFSVEYNITKCTGPGPQHNMQQQGMSC